MARVLYSKNYLLRTVGLRYKMLAPGYDGAQYCSTAQWK